MTRWHQQTSPTWEEPLTFASRFAGGDMALFYSGLRERFTGAFSYLFVAPQEVIQGDDWSVLPTSTDDNDLPQWVGYLGYELGDETSALAPSFIDLPKLRLIRYGQLFRFDHEQQHIDWFRSATNDASPLPALPAGIDYAAPSIHALTSNFTRMEYESVVANTINRIHAGDFYQANITRKFWGEFNGAPNRWQLFSQLCAISPAPYSAYIQHGETSILSSSPECFLSIDGGGCIITRPIKGSARRSDDAAADEKIKAELKASDKNHAENLMIVDLMRNDLSRVSVTGSVEVVEQSALYSYATIHHLISTIRAQKRPDATSAEVIRASFPAGSMTGAPKIAAMRWCAAQEKMARGVYSGAIGWLGGNNRCDLSVVIRTLIISGTQFEFQVGGGIVADSTPADEWHETLAKARAVASVLGLTEDDLAKI